MPVAIVDELEIVHVDEGQYESAVRPPCALHLVGQGQPPDLATIGPGQAIKVGRLELGLEAGTLPGGSSPIPVCPLTVRRRARPVPGGLGPEFVELLEELRPGPERTVEHDSIAAIQDGGNTLARRCQAISAPSRQVSIGRRSSA